MATTPSEPGTIVAFAIGHGIHAPVSSTLLSCAPGAPTLRTEV